MEYSKGNWSVGKYGSVVTDNGEGFLTTTGHDETEYYGGYLIAESILKPADAHLIAAAPDLLSALVDLTLVSDLSSHLLDRAEKAIMKARGITDVEFEEDES
jgi:hypothetical protein